MHTVCGYTFKPIWIKAIKAGNFTGWLMLNKRNVVKYYLETTKTQKGNFNQTRKILRSTKPKTNPLEKTDTSTLLGKKVRDVYTKVYDLRNTVFSDQTGKLPTRSKLVNKYITVMVEIGSNAILVDTINNRTDTELRRLYRAMMLHLKHTGIVPQKHVLDNEVSTAMKTIIRDEYKMKLEFLPPGCHRHNAS